MKDNDDKFMKELDAFKAGLAIDKHSLDDELQRQPSTFQEIGEAVAMAQAKRDYAKEKVTQVDAELAAIHRRKIEKNGVRATEALVNAAVSTDPRHDKAIKNRIEAQRRMDLLISAKDAYSQRSYMIRDLCSLFTASYFERTAVTESAPVKDLKSRKVMDKLAEARKASGTRKRKRE